MAQIIWTEPALSDFNEIAEYIALDDFSTAQKFVRHVLDAVEHLIQFPESGQVPPELSDSRYREIITGPCRVFYRYELEKNKLLIIYVMRGERMLRKYLIEEWAKLKS